MIPSTILDLWLDIQLIWAGSLCALDRPAEALVVIQEINAVISADELELDERSRTLYQLDLRRLTARALLLNNQPQAARQQLESVETLLETVTVAELTRPQIRMIAKTLQQKSTVEIREHAYLDSYNSLQRADQLLTQLHAQDLEDRATRVELARNKIQTALTVTAISATELMERNLREAIHLLQPVVTPESPHLDHRLSLIAAYDMLARIHLSKKQLDQTKRLNDLALQFFQERNPSTHVEGIELAKSNQLRAAIQLADGNATQSLELAGATLTQLDRSLAETPDETMGLQVKLMLLQTMLEASHQLQLIDRQLELLSQFETTLSAWLPLKPNREQVIWAQSCLLENKLLELKWHIEQGNFESMFDCVESIRDQEALRTIVLGKKWLPLLADATATGFSKSLASSQLDSRQRARLKKDVYYFLEGARQLGFHDWRHLETDPHWNVLKTDARLQKIIEQMKESESASDKPKSSDPK